jgi:hypothetical protein
MIHWNYLLSLEQDIIRLSNFIEFNKANFKTYSIEILKLNLAIGSEIDVVLKSLCKAYIPEKNYDSIKSYKIFLNSEFPEILSESISIPRYDFQFKPLEEIGMINAENKYKDPFWWGNYNMIKHHRDSEYSRADLRSLIYSFGALALINLYRIIKIKNISKPAELFKHVDNLSLYDFGDKYKMQVLGS